MKKLRQLPWSQQIQKTLIFFESSDQEAAIKAVSLIEEGQTYRLDKKWSVRSDPPHHSKMQHHLHLLCKGDEVCVINRDGSPSHNTNNNNVPNWVMRELKTRKLLESASFGARAMQVPTRVIVEAERCLRQERQRRLLARIRELMDKRSKPVTPANRLKRLLRELEK